MAGPAAPPSVAPGGGSSSFEETHVVPGAPSDGVIRLDTEPCLESLEDDLNVEIDKLPGGEETTNQALSEPAVPMLSLPEASRAPSTIANAGSFQDTALSARVCRVLWKGVRIMFVVLLLLR